MRTRSFAFFSEANSAIGMHEQLTNNGTLLTIAVAFCNPKDQFNKKTARDVLNGRINKSLSSNEHIQSTVHLEYHGSHPRRDVMAPFMDFLRTLPRQRDYNVIALAKSALESIAYAISNHHSEKEVRVAHPTTPENLDQLNQQEQPQEQLQNVMLVNPTLANVMRQSVRMDGMVYRHKKS